MSTVLKSIIKHSLLEIARGYVIKRLSSVSPDALIEAIEKDDYDVISKASETDKKRLMLVASRFSKYIDLINVKNVFEWMIEDLPFLAGVIYGHPKGIRWLDSVIKNTISYVKKELEKQ
ncbi:MAG: hypothetical protein QW253_00170 [Metallosphaera sp.]